jgi:hypothetical protein
MPSPPETDRQYAYFQAYGTGDPKDVTQILGIEPTECWKVGDEYERRGHTFKRRYSNWTLDSGHNDKQPLEAHIQALLQKLERHRNELLDIGTRYSTQIVCVSYAYQSSEFILSLDVQRRATDLGICFRFAAYSFGDHHEEIVELREQLGVRGDGSA